MKLIGENWKASVLQNDMKIVKLKKHENAIILTECVCRELS